MTKQEAAIISAYTGILIGDFSEMHKYAELLFKRPVFTHEFGNDKFFHDLKELAKPDFVSMDVSD